MRATEIIRNLLDIIDQVDDTKNEEAEIEIEIDTTDYEEETQYSNSPDEHYTHKDTLLSMGNDLNKPKHPSDIRADSVSMYPNMQYDPRKK
jgi:hypothetical protein